MSAIVCEHENQRSFRIFIRCLNVVMAALLLGGNLLLLGGCGSGLDVSKLSTTPMPQTPPSANQARIVFVRPVQRAGPGGYAVSVWADGSLVAFVRAGKRAFVDLPAGKHLLLAVAANGDVLEADLAPGKTYFVHTRLVSYYMGSSVFIDPMYQGHENWSQLQEWLDNTQLTELIPAEADEWTRRHASDNARRLERYESRPMADRKFIRPEFGI